MRVLREGVERALTESQKAKMYAQYTNTQNTTQRWLWRGRCTRGGTLSRGGWQASLSLPPTPLPLNPSLPLPGSPPPFPPPVFFARFGVVYFSGSSPPARAIDTRSSSGIRTRAITVSMCHSKQ